MAYDVFFLSNNEVSADSNWDILKRHYPSAKRVNGISGLLAAHKVCAAKSLTSHFFVIDSDNLILDYSIFDYKIPSYDSEYVHLWYAANPVNSLIYGWGGVKLFPKKIMLDSVDNSIDMTTSFDLKIIPIVASITKFNTSPYDAWRSSFREVFKLSRGLCGNSTIDENTDRIITWLNEGQGSHYGDWCMLGAKDGQLYAKNLAGVVLVNDWGWLRSEYDRLYPRDHTI